MFGSTITFWPCIVFTVMATSPRTTAVPPRNKVAVPSSSFTERAAPPFAWPMRAGLRPSAERRRFGFVGDVDTIVRTHAETGYDALYLGRRPNAYINGLDLAESEALLDELWAHATRPEYTWRHVWRAGDILIWDNRCVMHHREPFDAGARRVMHRIQCQGDKPYHASDALTGHPRAHVEKRVMHG